MTNNDTAAPTTADIMLEASRRRAADYRPVDLGGITARRLPPRDRSHSVRHRAISTRA